jgi:hypothetical protein
VTHSAGSGQGQADDRLVDALKRFTSRQASPNPPRPPRDTREWQTCIERELDAMNRRLTAIEGRVTIVFYLVVILTAVTVAQDAKVAEQLIKAVLKLP